MNGIGHRFASMGGEARVRLESADYDELERCAARVRGLLTACETAPTRFDDTSELSSFNRDARESVPMLLFVVPRDTAPGAREAAGYSWARWCASHRSR